MNYLRVISILIFCTICCSAKDGNDAKSIMIDAMNKFSIDLFSQALIRNSDPNLILSPLSTYIVLSSLTYGAKGVTFQQMKRALHLPDDNSIAFSGFSQILDEINKIENVELSVANKMYISNNLRVSSYFMDLSKRLFYTDVSSFNGSYPQESANSMNNWIYYATKRKINDIIDASEIGSDLRMLLLNAVYFKGDWLNEFNEAQTGYQYFYTGMFTRSVQTMFITKSFYYGDLPDLKATFVEMPYKNSDVRMTIILPYKGTHLNEIIRNLQLFNSSRLTEAGSMSTVKLSLPKFKINSTINLADHLKKLGMTRMFNSYLAEFTAIARERLDVSKIMQKAIVEVNEKGSEAAAATEVEIGFKLNANIINEFNVDHPALFIISLRNIIIFVGSIVNPTY